MKSLRQFALVAASSLLGLGVGLSAALATTPPRHAVRVSLDSIDGTRPGDIADHGFWLIKADRRHQDGSIRWLYWIHKGHAWATDEKYMDGSNQFLSYTGRFRLAGGGSSGESLAKFKRKYPRARIVKAVSDGPIDCPAPEWNALLTSTGTFKTLAGSNHEPVTTVFSFTFKTKRLRSVEMALGKKSLDASSIFDEPCSG
jgi:hypothetical protein